MAGIVLIVLIWGILSITSGDDIGFGILAISSFVVPLILGAILLWDDIKDAWNKNENK